MSWVKVSLDENVKIGRKCLDESVMDEIVFG